MLSINSSSRYFLYRKPTDMRFGIYSLSGLVRNELGCDPMSGDVFIFIGKRSNQVRLLQWDRDGFAMYIKKLEAGTFEQPEGEKSLITSRENPSHGGCNAQIGAITQAIYLFKNSLRKKCVSSLKSTLISVLRYFLYVS